MDSKEVPDPPPVAPLVPQDYQPPPYAPMQQAGQSKSFAVSSAPYIVSTHDSAPVHMSQSSSAVAPVQPVAPVEPIAPQWGPPAPHAQGPPQQMMGQPDITAFLPTPSLFVKQQIDYGEAVRDLLGGSVPDSLLQAVRDIDVSNVYNLYLDRAAADSKQRFMFAKEESDACTRFFCPKRREFKLRVGAPVRGPGFSLEERLGLVTSERVVPAIEIERPCFCFFSEMFVNDGQGRYIGRLDEECTNLCCCCPVGFSVTSGEGNMKVHGPSPCWMLCCVSCPCRDPYRFELKHREGSSVGTISNTKNSSCRTCFPAADDFEIKFAPHATADQRALLVAAMFALDYAYFESKNINTEDL